MDLYAPPTADVVDLTNIPEQTEVIDITDSAPGPSISSTTHPPTIQAGDIIIWFDGGHYGDYHKVVWSFVETVTPPNTMVLNFRLGLGYDWAVQVFHCVGPPSFLHNIAGVSSCWAILLLAEYLCWMDIS